MTPQTAAALRALEKKITKASELRLHLGEMTAQEMRTAKAAVAYTIAAISQATMANNEIAETVRDAARFIRNAFTKLAHERLEQAARIVELAAVLTQEGAEVFTESDIEQLGQFAPKKDRTKNKRVAPAKPARTVIDPFRAQAIAEVYEDDGTVLLNDEERIHQRAMQLAAAAPAEPRAAEGAGTAKSGEFDKFAAEFEAAHPEATARGREWVKDYVARKLAPTAAAAVPAGGDAVAWMARDASGRKDPNLWFTKPNARDGWELIPLYDRAAPRGGVTEAAWETALNQMPSKNWLAKWLKENSEQTIEELYALFQQRVRGRAKQLAASPPPAAQAQDAGPMARHWRIAITDYFRLAIKITEGSLCDWIEQRARALAAKETK